MASKQDFHKALTAIAYAKVGWRDAEIAVARELWRFDLTPEQKLAVQNESDRARIWSAAWKAGQDALVNPDAVPVRNGEQPDYRRPARGDRTLRPAGGGRRGSLRPLRAAPSEDMTFTREDVDMDMIMWECPECGEEHSDPDGLETHCRKCGLVVVAVEGIAMSTDWRIEMPTGCVWAAGCK